MNLFCRLGSSLLMPLLTSLGVGLALVAAGVPVACNPEAEPITEIQLRLSLPDNDLGSVPFSLVSLQLGELTYNLAQTASGTFTAYRNMELLDSVGVRAQLTFTLGSGSDRQIFTGAMNVVSNQNAVEITMEIEANPSLEVGEQEIEVGFSIVGDAFEDGWRYTAECNVELEPANRRLKSIRIDMQQEDEEIEDLE